MAELHEKLRAWKPNFVYVSSGIEVCDGRETKSSMSMSLSLLLQRKECLDIRRCWQGNLMIEDTSVIAARDSCCCALQVRGTADNVNDIVLKALTFPSKVAPDGMHSMRHIHTVPHMHAVCVILLRLWVLPSDFRWLRTTRASRALIPVRDTSSQVAYKSLWLQI